MFDNGTIYLTVIGTDPQNGHDVMHSDAQPWAVVDVTINDDGTSNIKRVHGRYATLRGAKQARQRRAAARWA